MSDQPTQLLKEAMREQPKRPPPLYDYMPVIEALLERRFTWAMIARWLTGHKVKCTTSGVYAAYNRWKQREIKK